MGDEILEGLQRHYSKLYWEIYRKSLGRSLLACWLMGKCGMSRLQAVMRLNRGNGEKHLLSHMLSLDASDTVPISKTEFHLTKDDNGDVDHDDGS